MSIGGLRGSRDLQSPRASRTCYVRLYLFLGAYREIRIHRLNIARCRILIIGLAFHYWPLAGGN